MPDVFTPELPVFADITAAVERLKGRTIRTPLLESPLLNQRMGRRILVKPECLQRTGSFKFRGASNKILALGDSVKTGGVVAYSRQSCPGCRCCCALCRYSSPDCHAVRCTRDQTRQYGGLGGRNSTIRPVHRKPGSLGPIHR